MLDDQSGPDYYHTAITGCAATVYKPASVGGASIPVQELAAVLNDAAVYTDGDSLCQSDPRARWDPAVGPVDSNGKRIVQIPLCRSG